MSPCCIRRFPIRILFILFLFSACTDADDKGSDSTGKKEGKGGAIYGGALHIPQTEQLQTLYPFAVTDLVSSHVAAQIHEGLYKFEPSDLSLKKALIKDHEVTENGKLHHFTLKEDIRFHPDPCFESEKEREITAEDVRFSFETLCTPSPRNENFKTTFKNRVKGAEAFYQGKADKISGFELVDEKKFRIELKRPSSSFLYVLALPAASIVPEEAMKEYGHELKVGAGPFCYDERVSEDELVLERFEDYHMKDTLGNELPFLDRIHFHFINSKNEQLRRFKKNKVHMIHGLPSDKVRSIVEEDIDEFTGKAPRFILGRTPEMSTQFYEFNLTRKVFKNEHVRKAFSYAIDRERLVEKVLNGEAYEAGTHGITPPTFKNYDIEEIQGYSFDPEKAREHLEKAGYPEGKGFPSIKIEFNKGGGKNTRVAVDIQNQIKEVLDINVDIERVSFSKKLENAKMARGDIYRGAWIADYPSPENFLQLAHGAQVPESLDEPSWPNTTRYRSAEFDSLFMKGSLAMDQDSAYHYFQEAEKVMMEDAPMIILWYGEQYRMINSSVKNYHFNPMKYFDFRSVYVKEE